MKKIGVVIGRFQGFTKAHQHLIYQAALGSDEVIVLIGSSNARKSVKNPWSAKDRIDMIKFCLNDWSGLYKLNFIEVNDHPSNEVWKENLQNEVYDFLNKQPEQDFNIKLYGCNKDDSTFYLDMFPDWKLELLEKFEGMDATDIRNAWFKGEQTNFYLQDNKVMHPSLPYWLFAQKFNADLQEEYKFYKNEKNNFRDYRYPETLNFCCADAVVYHNGYVLMIERGHAPGKGCLALTGGFKNNNETFMQAAIRELKEEAGITISDQELEDSNVLRQMFDDPKRSFGIPRVTMAHLFDISLIDGYEKIRPEIKAGDDAVNYVWVKIQDLFSMNNIYDDHAKIIYKLYMNYLHDL